jgi:hypothetical protein
MSWRRASPPVTCLSPSYLSRTLSGKLSATRSRRTSTDASEVRDRVEETRVSRASYGPSEVDLPLSMDLRDESVHSNTP